MNSDYFESAEALESYLVAHYGSNDLRHAMHPEAKEMRGSITDFVTEPLRVINPQFRGRALDLGCAMGRTTFELRRFFREVVGLDRSQSFISAAETMREHRQIAASLRETRNRDDLTKFELPAHLPTDGIRFQTGDACHLESSLGEFDLVMLTQLIDRVADPAGCLEQMKSFVVSGGWLVISTTGSWWEKFTPREKWLGDVCTGIVPGATASLAPFFELKNRFHLPYFIRERVHWYEWSIAEVSIWQRTPLPSTTSRPPESTHQ